MSQYAFGSGSLWGASTAANPTPARFGGLQDASVDFSFTTKPLFGQYQFPIAVGRGTAKVQGKAKFAQLQGRIMNDLLFGSTMATGQTLVADNESGTIPGTPYTITVANSATWVQDLGVINAVTGLPLVRVASAPATGQYSVAAGVYTFAAADTTNTVKISYTYTSASAGQTLTLSNQLLGSSTPFKAVMTSLYNNARMTITLNQCMSSKFTFATKLEDFVMPEFDWEAYCDSANNLGTISMAEAS